MTINERTQQAFEYLKCAADPVYFIDQHVQIRHPTQGIIPFHLWPWQAALIDLLHREQQVIVLKSRQLGVSEIAVAYALWLVRFQPAKTVLFLSKNDEDAKELLRRAKLAYEHLPPWLQCGPQSIHTCEVGEDNTSRFQIIHYDGDKHPHPSVIRSLPATEGAGRSASGSLVVLDEWAHQQFDSEIWAAVQPTTAAGGKILGISTANGLGNTFHAIWTKAETRENTFKPVFLSWRRHPDRDDAWYARTAADLDQPWRMHQEHPSSAAEAFVQSGHPVFNPATVARHEERVRAEHVVPLVVDGAPAQATVGLTVWELPQAGHEYIIGADVAEGLDTGDYDCATVGDRQTHVEVAELHGRWDPEVFALLLNWLGRYYLNALVAVERNNHGHAVLLALNSIHRYPHLYHHVDPLQPTKAHEARPGWPTTTVTKPLVIDALGKGMRDDTFLTRSLPFLAEASIFAVQKNGSMSAPSGFHDDRVMSRAITCHLLTQPSRTTHALLDHLREREAERDRFTGPLVPR